MSSDSDSGSVVSGKLPGDVHQGFEKYRQVQDITKSDAVRNLIRKGLESEQERSSKSKFVVLEAVLGVLSICGFIGMSGGIIQPSESAAISALAAVSILIVQAR